MKHDKLSPMRGFLQAPRLLETASQGATESLRGRGLAAALLLPRRQSDRCAPSRGPSSTPQYLGCADFHIQGRGALHLDANGSHVVMCCAPMSPDIPRWRLVEPPDDAGCSRAAELRPAALAASAGRRGPSGGGGACNPCRWRRGQP